MKSTRDDNDLPASTVVGLVLAFFLLFLFSFSRGLQKPSLLRVGMVLVVVLVFGSVHFLVGSCRSTVFCYHTKGCKDELANLAKLTLPPTLPWHLRGGVLQEETELPTALS